MAPYTSAAVRPVKRRPVGPPVVVAWAATISPAATAMRKLPRGSGCKAVPKRAGERTIDSRRERASAAAPAGAGGGIRRGGGGGGRLSGGGSRGGNVRRSRNRRLATAGAGRRPGRARARGLLVARRPGRPRLGR